MDFKLPWIPFFMTVVAVLLPPAALQPHLLRASPGGEGNSRPAALYGGPLDPADQGNQQNLYQYTLNQINTASGEDYRPQRMTKDPLSDYFLVEFASKSTGSLLVARGDFCADPTQELKTQISNIRLADSDNPYFMDSNCGTEKCGWDSFALYNGSVYFLLTGVLGRYPAELRREIQLRRLDGCDRSLRLASIGSGAVDFQILDCSSLIATVHSEPYAWPNPSLGAWTTGSMIAITGSATPTDGDGSAIFLLQLVRKLSSSRVDINLIQVVTSRDAASSVRTLHSAETADEFGGNWVFPALGEISHEGSTLCWTAAERLICSLVEVSHDGVTITEWRQLVAPGEARKAGICSGDVSPLPYGDVLTGVAIARAADPLSVHFGCYSASTRVGGAGVVRVSSIGAAQLSRVTNSNTKLLAGALLTTPHFGADCRATTPPPPSPDCVAKTTGGRDAGDDATDVTYAAGTACSCVHVDEPAPLTLGAAHARVGVATLLGGVVCAVWMASRR